MRVIDTPDFANEAEEARWWFENQHVIEQAFKEDHGVEIISVLVPLEDADLAKRRVQDSGMEYNEFMAQLLHRALRDAA